MSAARGDEPSSAARGDEPSSAARGDEPVGAGPALVLDCRGMRCPLPVIELAKRFAEVPVDAVVRVLADDPAARLDIPAWCRMRSQHYEGEPEPGTYDVRRLA